MDFKYLLKFFYNDKSDQMIERVVHTVCESHNPMNPSKTEKTQELLEKVLSSILG